MGKISLADRKEQSTFIVLSLKQQKEKDELNDEQFIQRVYNAAIRDVEDAIGVYVDKNPQHALSLMALKDELEWMPLVR